jgi:hypothetical protein
VRLCLNLFGEGLWKSDGDRFHSDRVLRYCQIRKTKAHLLFTPIAEPA